MQQAVGLHLLDDLACLQQAQAGRAADTDSGGQEDSRIDAVTGIAIVVRKDATDFRA